ncbi:MAG: DNA repair protein RecO [Acaryochloridaceae cyanobacterium CSU_3_4]|nr:DNA repair protein RecO [Acaryochloris sp. SU_5_25]NJN38079.1 DNA repair protein RecO [Acaryochloridaceae cyanobacterium CSU_3_4]
MSRTYKATGINLKTMPLGESDRLLTILTREQGLIKAVAPGSRKPKSQLGGRSALFVVNDLLLIQGRSLDKIAQAETLESYSGLSQNLAKLTISQYLAELTLYQALSGQPQIELWDLFCQQLNQLQAASLDQLPFCLIYGTLQLLTGAGIAPQVHTCCFTHEPLSPPLTDAHWRVGFSLSAGGAVMLSSVSSFSRSHLSPQYTTGAPSVPVVREGCNDLRSVVDHRPLPGKLVQLSAQELSLLQTLTSAERDTHSSLHCSLATAQPYPLSVWQAVESALRHYAEAYFDRPIRSAALLDTCFSTLPDLVTPVHP